MTKLFGKTIKARTGPVKTPVQIAAGIVSVLSLFFTVLAGQIWHTTLGALATFALAASFLIAGALSQIEFIDEAPHDGGARFGDGGM